MALTQEQVQTYRKKFNLDQIQGTSTQNLHQERMRRLNPIVAKQSNEKQMIELERNKITAGDIVTGAAKGALSTVRGAASLGEKGIKALGRVLTPKSLEDDLGFAKEDTTASERIISEEAVTPENKGQKIGFYGEQIVEFLIPGGAITRASKAVSFGKVGQLATRAVLEGVTTAGQTALQEGEVDKGTLAIGGFASVFPIASKVLSAPFKNLGKSAWAGILKRSPSSVAKNPKLEEQILKEGILTKSQAGLASHAGEVIQQIEVQLDDILSKTTEQIPTSVVIDHLNALKDAYAKIPGEKNSLAIIDDIGKDILAKGESITALEANELKRGIYAVIERTYGKGFMDIPVKKEALKTIARALKEEVEKVAPEAKNLNQRQAIYLQIKKAIGQRMARESGKGMLPFVGNIGLFDLLTGLGGGIYGARQGDAGTALTYGLGAAGLKKAFNSPAFLSGLAKVADHFNSISPTKKALFLRGLEGAIVQPLKDTEANEQP